MARALSTEEVKTALAGRQLCGSRNGEHFCTMPRGHDANRSDASRIHYDMRAFETFTLKRVDFNPRRTDRPTRLEPEWLAQAVHPGGAPGPEHETPELAAETVTEVIEVPAALVRTKAVIDWKSKITPVTPQQEATQPDLFEENS